MSIVGLLTNLVPYHHARWQAFAQNSGSKCVVLELTSQDEFSVLQVPELQGASYERVALFPRRPRAFIPMAEIPREMARFLERRRPDCVCLNGYAAPMALAALSWCARRRVPAVMMSESTAWDTPRQPLKEWLKSRVVRRCASALVGGAPQLDYLAALGMPHERIFSGYDVVDNEHFALGASQARARGDELRKKLGLPERYLLASARFSPKKNLARLLDAYAGYLKQVFAEDPWHLVVLGDGAGREALLAQRAKLGLEKHIHLPGAKPYAELPVYYGLASAFIHASTTEQWGLVVNEAMASGLPVLVSQHCGCARDLVRNEMNGFTFDPYSTEDITEKILRLFRSPDCVATFGRASQEVMARWSPTRFAQGLSAAIEIALSSPTRSSPLDRIFLSILARYSGGNAATN